MEMISQVNGNLGGSKTKGARHLLPILPLVRLGGVALTAFVASTAGEKLEWVALALFSAHYTMAFWYSAPRARRLLDHPASALWVWALVLAGTVWYQLSPLPWVFLFGLHHLLTESYLLPPGERTQGPVWGRLAWEGAVYFALLRHHPHPIFAALPLPVYLAGMAGAAVFCAADLWKLPRPLKSELLGYHAVGFFAVALSAFWPITLTDVVIYHVMVWALFPLVRRAPEFRPGRFVACHGLSAVFFFALTPAAGRWLSIPVDLLRQGFAFFSFLHIGSSLVLSPVNPGWARRAVERMIRLGCPA